MVSGIPSVFDTEDNFLHPLSLHDKIIFIYSQIINNNKDRKIPVTNLIHVYNHIQKNKVNNIVRK